MEDPKYLRLKHNNALKHIQQKYKPRSYGLETFICCHDDCLVEKIYFEIEPKIKTMSFFWISLKNKINISKN